MYGKKLTAEGQIEAAKACAEGKCVRKKPHGNLQWIRFLGLKKSLKNDLIECEGQALPFYSPPCDSVIQALSAFLTR